MLEGVGRGIFQDTIVALTNGPEDNLFRCQ
jgi:hypothetical protein